MNSKHKPKADENSTLDRVFQIRIDQDLYDLIASYSDLLDIKKSELARQAIYKYILTMTNTKSPNQKIMFSHNMFRILMDHASPEIIQQLSKISFQNGLGTLKMFQETLPEHIKKQYNFDSFSQLLSSSINMVFAQDKQNWFQEITYEISEKNQIIVKGMHHLGTNFSLFFMQLLKFYANEKHYQLIDEEYNILTHMTRKQDDLFSTSEEFQLKLTFKPTR